jgi:beta-1,4-mannosyl-glycoprotein beta-1,4-N-acetylglucosaminyltransferase
MKNTYNIVKLLIPRAIKVKLIELNVWLSRLYTTLTSELPLVNFPRKSLNSHDSLKVGKVYDCFYFFNELDVLEIRLNILYDYVDYFVICESNTSFTGKQKKLLYLDNKERFRKFEDKIIYAPLNWSPVNRDDVTSIFHQNSSVLERLIAQRTLTNTNVPLGPENNHWVIEFYQKEALHFSLVDLADEDVVYISDVDEIWNPNRDFEIESDKIYVFKQKPYIYFLNNQSNEHWHNWTGTIVSRFKTIKNLSINDARTHGKLKRYVVNRGGWHFSFQGGRNVIIEKLDSYGHQEFNTLEIKDNLENVMKYNLDYRGRAIKYQKDENYLPKYLLDNKNNYPEMFL